MNLKNALLGLTGILLSGCPPHSPRPTDHLFSQSFTAMGHRGAAGLAPENTLASFDQAIRLGVPFELDIHQAADGQLVVFHDTDLERCTGQVGNVAEWTTERLKELDAGSHFGPDFADERIPTLEEVFQRVDRKVLINIEVKSVQGTDNAKMAVELDRLIEQYQLADAVIVTSFSPFFLEEIRKVNPNLIRGQITGTFKGSDLKFYERWALRGLAFNKRAVPDMLMIEHKLASKRYLKKMHRRGYRVMAWTVNDPVRMRELIDLGIDGLLSDRPDQLLEASQGK